jgi:hypothetical protein
VKRADVDPDGYVVHRERLLAVMADIKPYAKDAKTRKRFQDIERQIRTVAAKLDEQG